MQSPHKSQFTTLHCSSQYEKQQAIPGLLSDRQAGALPDIFHFFAQFGSCQMYQSVPSVSMMTVPSPE